MAKVKAKAKKKLNNWDTIANKLKTLLKQKAVAFLEENSQDVLELGADAVTAILREEIFLYARIPDPPKKPSLEFITEREAVIHSNSLRIQLISAATKKDSERVERIRNSAKNVAREVAFAISGLSLGLLKTALGM